MPLCKNLKKRFAPSCIKQLFISLPKTSEDLTSTLSGGASFFHFFPPDSLILLSSLSPTGNSHVQWTVKEKIVSSFSNTFMAIYTYKQTCKDQMSLLCMQAPMWAYWCRYHAFKKCSSAGLRAVVVAVSKLWSCSFAKQQQLCMFATTLMSTVKMAKIFMAVISYIYRPLLSPFSHLPLWHLAHALLKTQLQMLLIKTTSSLQMKTHIFLQSVHSTDLLITRAG